MNRFPRRFYQFASFRVDVAERQLWRDGELVPLTSKIFDILLVLVENSGHTLGKDELMSRVWSDTFVEEGNLNRSISTLRKVLGDDSHEQRFIKTVPKQGYRFTADVKEILEDEETVMVENKTRYQLKVWEEVREKEKWSGLWSFRFTSVIAILCLIVVIAFVFVWNRTQKNGARNLSSVNETKSTEAWEFYKRGRALWQTRNGESLHKATVLLEQAVQKDPNFALAHAALADAYVFDFRYWQKAESTALEAIRLDPNLGEPHATIGFAKMFWEWKLKEAEAEFKKAVQLSPDYAIAHQWYAINLWTISNAGNAAYAEMKLALELEPNSASINADMCQTLYFLRRYDEAIAQCKKTLTLDDKFQNAHQYLYEIYNTKGMHAEAVETFFKIEEISLIPLPLDLLDNLRKAYQTGGILTFWKMRIKFLTTNYRIAQHYARLGEKDRSLFYLRQAYETRDFEFYLFLADPVFDEFRDDSRYLELKNLLLN